MENVVGAIKHKCSVKRFLLDVETGHVLSASLNRGAITKSFKSAKYRDDLEACGCRLSELSEKVRNFLVGAELITKINEIEIYRIKGNCFAVYQCGDRWGTTFLNCVLITNTVGVRRSVAKECHMRLVVGLTDWLHSTHTGLIDADAKDTITSLLKLPLVQDLTSSDRRR